MSDETVNILSEAGRWKSRDVSYWAGTWEQLSKLIPEFKTAEFRAADNAPPNPYMKTVVRVPLTRAEREIPVGVVSNTYGLAPHKMVVERCLDGIRFAGIDPKSLRCELGLTELDELMNFRLYFPDEYSHTPKDKQVLGLRLECFNSVDGSSRLVILLGWLRLVCTNRLVISETKTELREVHNRHLNLNRIPEIVGEALEKVRGDKARMMRWQEIDVETETLKSWVNRDVTGKWGKLAACRTFHICDSGYDVEFADPFAQGTATEKPVKKTLRVPGSPEKAQNLYDASQALSWVTTRRNDPEERLQWQTDIPQLIARLSG
jgi:hypothetical protein